MSQQPITVRVATFNVENLFSRVTFPTHVAPGEDHVGLYQFEDPEELKLARMIVEAAASDDKRQLTALALLECDADVCCLQEVDNVHALRVFYERYVKPQLDITAARGRRELLRGAAQQGRTASDDEIRAVDRKFFYDWRDVIEGNDGRGIDVGVISRLPIRVRSHAHHTFQSLNIWLPELDNYRETLDGKPHVLVPDDKIFRRDCLEVDLEVEGVPLTIYICHLKSMGSSRRRTFPLRHAEARAIRKLIEMRFGDGVGDANWVVCGDFNDFFEVDGEPVTDVHGKALPHSMLPLLADDFAVNLIGRREPLDRWTTYHAPSDTYSQLDFIWASPALARLNPFAVPTIIRAGQPYRARRYAGPRYPRVGWDRPKASDHCPVVVELAIGHRA